jgi:hypothetical protein
MVVMRIFVADDLCVSVEDIDFLNPNRLADGRERGVRVELRMIEPDDSAGSIYVSRGLAIGRAVCRFDLLESAPAAQDRMHWHPEMADGEPSQRLFDPELRADPLGFLGGRLRDAVGLLTMVGVSDADRFARAAATLATVADAVVADVAASLERQRRDPWPEVRDRDERGMAVAAAG